MRRFGTKNLLEQSVAPHQPMIQWIQNYMALNGFKYVDADERMYDIHRNAEAPGVEIRVWSEPSRPEKARIEIEAPEYSRVITPLTWNTSTQREVENALQPYLP